MTLPSETAPATLALDRALFEQMRLHVTSLAPEEACGLLVGRRKDARAAATAVLPVTNTLHSPVRYRMEPHEQLAAFHQMDAQDLELVGIFHSHPLGPPGPSATDLAEAFYPQAVYLIWSGVTAAWECHAFGLRDGQFVPVVLEFLTESRA